MTHLTPEELSARLDGALTGAASERADSHLAACAACRESLAVLAAQDASLRPALEHDPGDAYFSDFAARVEDRIRAAGLRGAQSRLGAGGMLGWLRSPRRVAWVGAAAAVIAGAAVVLVTARLDTPVLGPEVPRTVGGREDVIAREETRQEATGPAAETPALESAPALPAPSAQIGQEARKRTAASPAPAAGAARPVAPGASTGRLIEVRRTEAGEDVPVRAEDLAAPPAETDARVQETPEGQRQIVKPRAAAPMKQLDREATPSVAPLSAGNAETRLCGRVLDPAGRPVAGAVVALADLGRTATTDATGRFCLGAPSGVHDLTAMAVGYEQSRMQVRAEGPTTDALVTLNPVTVLDGGGASGNLGFAKSPEDAFAGLSAGAQTLLRTAQRLTLRARSAGQFDAAGTAWQKLAAAAPAGEARVEALYRAAEVRTRAWQLGPTTARAEAARLAVAAYLQVAPESAKREQAERWRASFR